MDMARKRIIIAVTNNLVTDYRVAKLAGYLESIGFEVWLVGRRWPDGTIPSGRPGKLFRFRLLFNKGPFFYLSINIRIFIFLLFHKADWFLAVDLDVLPACVIAGKLKRIPVVMDSHEYFPEIPEVQHRPIVKMVWQMLEKIFIRAIYAGITVSPGLVSIYKEKYNLDFLLLRNMPLKKSEVAEVSINIVNPVVYYQGALNIGRGLESAIRAIALLPDYRFVIIGDGDVSAKLKELVTELKLDNRVSFVGKLPFEELQYYIRSAHVGLCLLQNIGLNYYHSLPNRIFDYPMSGLPVIATAFPDISKVVSEYETGLLLEGLNPEDIAVMIKRACEDTQLRKNWSVTLPKAADKLSWENEVTVLDGVFCSK